MPLPLCSPRPQLSVPQLRPGVAQRSFNAELSQCDYDLNRWRQ